MKRASAVAMALVVSCSQPPPVKARYGEVMAELGRRFERSGKAAVAGRWELAAFEVGELKEICTAALPRAELPQEGPTAALGALTEVFVTTALPPMAAAARARSATAFAAAFQAAAVQCNACHASTEKAFIEVPLVAGAEVPLLTAVEPPRPTPSPR